MKFIKLTLLPVIALLFLLIACDKENLLPVYTNGTAPKLQASTTTIAPAPADSDKVALTLNWSNPKYATDSSNQKFTVEIDSTGKNFSGEATKVVTGSLSTSFTAKELNNILTGFGYAFNVPVTMDVRVTSSYANNNERLSSNVIKITMTPYVVPPKVAPPASKTLFIVGSATAGGWGNPVPVPAQQFTMVDSVTYQGTFFLNGGGAYDLLPVNGSWATKYNVASGSVNGLSAGGDFQFSTGPGSDIPGPATTGMYKITVSFQSGKFTVTPVQTFGLLYVPGDYQGWSPSTAPALGSPNNDGNYDGYINIPAGGTYQFKFTPKPDWSSSLGDGGSGTLSSSGGNLTVPGGGYYHIVANTTANTWSATAITSWSLIGDFDGWSSDVDMTNNNGVWTGTITAASAGGFKFRANHDWTLNYGDKGADGSLEINGDNIAISAGTHTITLYLNNAGYYTYTIQ